MTKWAVHEVPPLPFFARGRVALTGDAAHAMQSHSGSGANQTIEARSTCRHTPRR